jgi:hypothetical protein
LLVPAFAALNSVIEGAGRVAGWAGLLGGALAIFAIVRGGERAVMVFAALVLALFVVGLNAAELLFPPN